MKTQAIWKLASKIACVFILMGRKPEIGESRSEKLEGIGELKRACPFYSFHRKDHVAVKRESP